MFRPDRLLTDADARDILGVSRTTLWRLRTRKGLPFLRIGSEIRYEPAAFQAWVEQQYAGTSRSHVHLDEARDATELRWKHRIEEADWAFTDMRTNLLTHHLHPYPAKFPPPLPRQLIEILTEPGATVLDPFCGSGTTMVEAKAIGRRSIGVDSNPVAVLVSSAKTQLLDEESFEALDGLGGAIEAAIARITGQLNLSTLLTEDVAPSAPPDIPNRDRWFTDQAIYELGLIKAHIEDMEASPAVTVATACFSAILIKASNQDSETRYTSKPRPVNPGDTLRSFRVKVNEAVAMLRRWQIAASPATASCIVGDTRQLTSVELGKADAVITSPPYANAFDYHLYHRHRLFWLGFDPKEVRKMEIGSHLNYQGDRDPITIYRRDLRDCLRSIATCLKNGSPIAIVVGDSVFGGTVVNNAAIVSEAGRELGLRTLACVNRTIHPSKRSMNHAARRARQEYILLMVTE